MKKFLFVALMLLFAAVFLKTQVSASTISNNKKSNITNITKKKSALKKIKIKLQRSNPKLISASITDRDGLTPSEFALKVGVPVKLEIEVTGDIDPYGCMSTITIPGLYKGAFAVREGKKIVMEFTPKKVGEFYITCVMGESWGVIKVSK